MRCPKCGYNSFDHLDSCKKCGKDLAEFKQSFGIKSVLFPGQMSAVGMAEQDELDNLSADVAVAAATGVTAATAAAVNGPSDTPMAEGADGDDFGFDFMGDSAEDDDLSFDELFEEAPEDEDIEETIEAPKEATASSEAQSDEDFSFDLPDEEDDLEDDFGFDPVDEAIDSADEKAFSFDDDPVSASESDDSGDEEGPKRPFDLPESPQVVGAPEADPKTFAEPAAIFTPIEEINVLSEAPPASLAAEDTEEIYILEEAEVVSPPPTADEQFELKVPQGGVAFESSVAPLTSQANLLQEESPAVSAAGHEEVVTDPPLSRPPLGSCFGAFIFDVGLLAIVGISFVVAAEAAMSTGKTRLLPSLDTLIDLSVPYFLVLFFLAFGYFTLFHFLAGQTPGKMLVGLRVEATDGEPLVFSQAFLRSVGGLFQLIPVGLGYLLILTSPERRGWNDRLAGTRVVALRDLL